MKNTIKILLTTALVGFTVAMLSGCTDGSKFGGGWASSGDPNAPERGYAYGTGVDSTPVFMGKDGKLTTGSNAVQDQFYFQFDSSELDATAKSELRRHARYLLTNKSTKIRLEGHTDERGSREYNVALGERRASSVAQELFSEGVSRDQIAIVSYGQEKPSTLGHDESAWKWNRRAKVAYELG